MANKLSISPKNKIIIVLTVVLIIIVVLKIYSGTKTPPSQIQNIPTPIPRFSPVPPSPTPNFEFEEILQPTITYNFPLLGFIPYKSTNFSVDYVKSLTLIVILKKDTPEIRQEVLDWISSKGVDPSTHKIEWKLK